MFKVIILVFVGIMLLVTLITSLLKKELSNNSNNDIKNDVEKERIYTYSLKSFMTENEREFYYKLIELKKLYNVQIIPQVCLSSLIRCDNALYSGNQILYKIIDFVIFDETYHNILLLIELNDITHNYSNRRLRDMKVQTISKSVGLDVMFFYTRYPNDKEYIISRIGKYFDDNNINVKKQL